YVIKSSRFGTFYHTLGDRGHNHQDKTTQEGSLQTGAQGNQHLSSSQTDQVMVFQRAFLFLVLLCATVMVHGQPADVSPRYQRFLLQHVTGGMTIQNCQHVMSNLKLTGPDGKCKWKNTFIVANSNQVKAICGLGGTHRNLNLFESNNPFPVVICKRTGGDYHPNCTYKGSKPTRTVVIACDRGWPVHYDGDIFPTAGQ
ncbi:unnamed protein product, partial [Coregonus sp. 'balchen']